MHLSAHDIAEGAGGEVVAGDPEARATSFCHDSRSLLPGACFVALRGHRDGHDFAREAFEAGCTVALVARIPEGLRMEPGRALVSVADPLSALGRLAGHCRVTALAGVTVVGITGSTGKTSTKDLTSAAIRRFRSVHANPDSFNNELGLPLTLLGAGPHTDVVIAEMGARFAGNIAELCAVARPQAGVVTNIGLAHAEHLGGSDGALAVKGELLAALPNDGLAVVNADDPACDRLASMTGARVIRVGRARSAEVHISESHLDDQLRPTLRIDSPWGSVVARLLVRGEHQVENAGLAAAVALWLGVPPEEVSLGLAEATASRWRLEVSHSPAGLTVLNDAYNANPASMDAALRSLARIATTGRRVAVLGEMRELGDLADEAHADVGRLAAALGIDVLVAVGDLGPLVGEAAAGVVEVCAVADPAEALEVAARLARPRDVVLVKGSRAVGLEVVAAALVSGAADARVPAAGSHGGDAS